MSRGESVQSLVRALTLLNRIAEAGDGGASLTELAQQVGLPSSTAHRLLTTLEQERYVRFDRDERRWSVGVQAFVTGGAFAKTRNLGALARPQMRRLMETVGETVSLAVEDDGEAVYLAQVECRQMMRVFAKLGSRAPMHCSAVGKAMLALAPDAKLTKILLSRGLPRLTERTLTDPAALRAELARVRSLGYAVDDEEHAVGLRCVGAAVVDDAGEVVAAISASGPAARASLDRLEAMGAQVRAAAAAISAELGAR